MFQSSEWINLNLFFYEKVLYTPSHFCLFSFSEFFQLLLSSILYFFCSFHCQYCTILSLVSVHHSDFVKCVWRATSHVLWSYMWDTYVNASGTAFALWWLMGGLALPFIFPVLICTKPEFFINKGTEENYYDDSYLYHLHRSSSALHHEV